MGHVELFILSASLQKHEGLSQIFINAILIGTDGEQEVTNEKLIEKK